MISKAAVLNLALRGRVAVPSFVIWLVSEGTRVFVLSSSQGKPRNPMMTLRLPNAALAVVIVRDRLASTSLVEMQLSHRNCSFGGGQDAL
jgi:hypothetical protein